MMYPLRLFCLVLCLSSLRLAAQQTEPSISYRAQEIVVDGQLDEAAWQGLPVFDSFFNFYPINDGKAVLKTEVRAFTNGKQLNIAVVYHDTTARVNVSSLKRDNYGEGMHLSDCFGLIIDSYNNQNRGYFFGLNGAGTQVDGLIGNFDDLNTSWNAIWYGKTEVDGTDKIYELSIPLNTINYDPEVSEWSFQFYTRDTKSNLYTTWTKFPRGFLQFDTRHLRRIKMENLQANKSARLTLIPSVTTTYFADQANDTRRKTLKPSLDLQYNITSGLRLDATLNPDFSQIDVDRQVTNLTRFSIIFPERRNFFLENSDLFSNLGTNNNINPLNSRKIGATGDLLFGAKLSGNILPRTRIGILDVQGREADGQGADNYAVVAAQQQLSQQFRATGYLVNRQATRNYQFTNDYNRVLGANLNFISPNKRWTGLANYGKSFSDSIRTADSFFNLEGAYQTRELTFRSIASHVGGNYLTDVGFVPRLYNFDPQQEQVIREGYTHFSNSATMMAFPKSKWIDSFRWFRFRVDTYLDDQGKFWENNLFLNQAILFRNLSAVYVNAYHDRVQLKYGFDPLRNGFLLEPGAYTSTAVRLGFNSDNTQKFYYSFNGQLGTFYGGIRKRFAVDLGYRMLPFGSINAYYEYNHLDFARNGLRDFHLIGFVGEVFFSNTLNWTTYLQYNTQFDNFNLNTRLQWEYRPLSYLYLVYTDNYDQEFSQQNRAISLKLNYRLNL